MPTPFLSKSEKNRLYKDIVTERIEKTTKPFWEVFDKLFSRINEVEKLLGGTNNDIQNKQR